MRSCGLYIHFPFCIRKCLYCDFLSFPASEDEKSLYTSALIREIRSYAREAKSLSVDTVFLGGGTPSVMQAGDLSAVMDAVFGTFSVEEGAEISMEMNPGTIREETLEFVSSCINRVSLGVQSASDRELMSLGRIHSFADALRSVSLLREAGIRNLNLDLMSALPGQTETDWEATLSAAVSLKPEHISAYSLIIEEGTPFHDLCREGKLDLPDEDTERRMYAGTEAFLKAEGYERYEISNYARPGFMCRHNSRYWTGGDYLGLGLGASSFFKGTRWKNTDRPGQYIEYSGNPDMLREEVHKTGAREAMEEFMFLGLRMMQGISETEFCRRFGVSLGAVYGEVISRLKREGLLAEGESEEDRRLFLTNRGIDVSNRVLSEFLL